MQRKQNEKLPMHLNIKRPSQVLTKSTSSGCLSGYDLGREIQTGRDAERYVERQRCGGGFRVVRKHIT